MARRYRTKKLNAARSGLLSATEASRLAEIDLTPGDYRCAREMLFFTCEHAINEDRVAALEAEAARKPKKAGRLGF